MTFEDQQRERNSGFLGYKNSVTGRLTPLPWELLVKGLVTFNFKNGSSIAVQKDSDMYKTLINHPHCKQTKS